MFKTMISGIVQRNLKNKVLKSTIKEEDIKDVLREIRIALLDADVNIIVVKDLINGIKKDLVGKIIPEDTKFSDFFLNSVKTQLTDILGKEFKELNVERPNLKILMVGLQGSGKTTTCAKLAKYLMDKRKNSKATLVALDVYRAAAIDQLKQLATDINIGCIEEGQGDPLKIVDDALEQIKNKNINISIFDTAGRLQTDEKLMSELVALKKKIQPDEIFLVVDSMSGQDIINVAKEFHNHLNLSGIILTKMDSDARAGAALSLIKILNVPIRFLGTGEKVGSIDEFYPERIADRILGLGDILTLSEKAYNVIDEKDVKRSMARMFSGKFDLDDMLNQIEQMDKIGSFSSMMKYMPDKVKSSLTEDKVIQAEQKAKVWRILLSSMTKKERHNPKLIIKDQTRKNRILNGSGRKQEELNKMLKDWQKAKENFDKMAKMMQNGRDPWKEMGF